VFLFRTLRAEGWWWEQLRPGRRREGGGRAEGFAGGAFELGDDPVEEVVDLLHLVAAEGGLEAGLLDGFRGEGGLVARGVGGGAVAEAVQVVGGPFEQAADLASLVPSDDPGEGPLPDLFRGEPAFGHGARFSWAVMATSSVLLDPVGWQTEPPVTDRHPNRDRLETDRGRVRDGADRVS
jgi:hypothetical protein